jgi:hypothetical protein
MCTRTQQHLSLLRGLLLYEVQTLFQQCTSCLPSFAAYLSENKNSYKSLRGWNLPLPIYINRKRLLWWQNLLKKNLNFEYLFVFLQNMTSRQFVIVVRKFLLQARWITRIQRSLLWVGSRALLLPANNSFKLGCKTQLMYYQHPGQMCATCCELLTWKNWPSIWRWRNTRISVKMVYSRVCCTNAELKKKMPCRITWVVHP